MDGWNNEPRGRRRRRLLNHLFVAALIFMREFDLAQIAGGKFPALLLLLDALALI
jgi:hypothetical protein